MIDPRVEIVCPLLSALLRGFVEFSFGAGKEKERIVFPLRIFELALLEACFLFYNMKKHLILSLPPLLY